MHRGNLGPLGRIFGFDSTKYWRKRYKKQGTSGEGSVGRSATWKSLILNDFINKNEIHTAIEFGCGDGDQLGLVQVPKYIGLDPSSDAINLCIEKYSDDKSKSFFTIDPATFTNNQGILADIAISQDVILHLIEDSKYEKHLEDLFGGGTGNKFVGIYSMATNKNNPKQGIHVKFRDHRTVVSSKFPEWTLISFESAGKYLNEPQELGYYFYKRP